MIADIYVRGGGIFSEFRFARRVLPCKGNCLLRKGRTLVTLKSKIFLIFHMQSFSLYILPPSIIISTQCVDEHKDPLRLVLSVNILSKYFL